MQSCPSLVYLNLEKYTINGTRLQEHTTCLGGGGEGRGREGARPRILPISLLIVFTAPSTVPGPWQVTCWIFYKFRKQLWYMEQKDFLKTFLEIPSPLPTHSTTYYSKNRKASIVKCCCFFSVSRVIQEGPYEVISPFLLDFSTCSNQSKIQLTSSRDIHGVYHEPDWYVGPHRAQSHMLTDLENLVSSILELVNKVLSVTGAQRRRIVSG